MLTKEEYKEAKKRMCASFGGCRIECPLWGLTCSTVRVFTALEVVEEWAKKHPTQTNREKFLEVFGSNAVLSSGSDWWGKEYIEPPTRGGK